MSYYTTFDIYLEGEQVPTDAVLGVADAFLRRQASYAVEDILEDLRKSLEEGRAELKLYFYDIDLLLKNISLAFPTTVFCARGFGEEFDDVWLRKYALGNAISAIGPGDSAR